MHTNDVPQFQDTKWLRFPVCFNAYDERHLYLLQPKETLESNLQEQGCRKWHEATMLWLFYKEEYRKWLNNYLIDHSLVYKIGP